MEVLPFPSANHAIELDVRTVEFFATRFLARADSPHQLHAFIAIKVTVVIIQVIEVGIGGVLEFAITSLKTPYISPMGRRRVVGAKKIVCTGDPFIEILLHQPSGNDTGLCDARQAS